MEQNERISLDLWEILNHFYFNGRDVFWAEPDPMSIYLLSDHDVERYERHYFYFETRFRYSSIAIAILSVACLEAYANELISLLPNLPATRRSHMRKMSIRNKYRHLLEYVSGKPVDSQSEPFRSFCDLVNTRNALTHFDPTPQIMAVYSTDFPQWVKGTLSSILREIYCCLKDDTICLDPDMPSYVTGYKWQP